MWDSDSHSPREGTTRVCVLQDGEAISYATAIDLLGGSEDFRTWFVDALARAPYSSYFWETPPITDTTIDRDFEYVLVDGPTLALQRARYSVHSPSTSRLGQVPGPSQSHPIWAAMQS